MGLIFGPPVARVARRPVANATLDRDEAVQSETRNVALAVVAAVRALRSGQLTQPDADLQRPRPK